MTNPNHLMNHNIDTNPYELLDVKLEANEQEIRTAYRQRSLKVHPDRNPNNPDAARKFHELNQAYELLLDPLRRLAVDAKLRLKQARAERFKSYDNKRKNMLDELEVAEQLAKKARVDKQKEEQQRWHETEQIKEEGRRLREEKERELNKMEERRNVSLESQEELDAPSLDSLDTTIRLKYALKSHPNLTTPEAIAQLMSLFGQTDAESIVLSLKSPKKDLNKPPKFGTALVPFKQIGDAFAAVCASGKSDRGLEGIEVGWLGGKEPPILVWLKKMGKLGTSTPPRVSKGNENEKLKGEANLPQAEATAKPSAFSSFPASLPYISQRPKTPEVALPGIDYESLTLMRLRQAERERLEREIREQEANE